LLVVDQKSKILFDLEAVKDPHGREFLMGPSAMLFHHTPDQLHLLERCVAVWRRSPLQLRFPFKFGRVGKKDACRNAFRECIMQQPLTIGSVLC
jgi:hypothetical protein